MIYVVKQIFNNLFQLINILYIINMQASVKLNQEKLPVTYFDLIQKVGSGARYQLLMMIIFTIMWFCTGIILMSTAFLFWNMPFDCIQHGLLVKDCAQVVCKLPKQQWILYIDKEHDFVSIATQFDYYFCSDELIINLASSAVYFGAFLGYLGFSFFSDNFGRRSSILLAWGCATLGGIILAVSVNIPMAAVGLFFAGAGSDAAINICFYFFSEVVEDEKRQKYSIVVQIAFTIGAILVTILFYIIPSWRIVVIISITVPALIAFILVFLFVQETPQFLLRKGVQQTLRALNRIGKINFGRNSILNEEDINNVKFEQVAEKEFQQVITPLDLFRFPSLRTVTICSAIVSFAIYAMYYGPVLIIDEIGFDIYTSNIIIQLSQLVCFIPIYFYVQKLPRQKSGIVLFAVCAVCAGILIFFEKPEDCDGCTQSVVELVFIFIFRFSISFYFALFNLYFIELYPSRARGLGVGIVSAIGTIASTSSPIYLGILKRNNFNVMIIFTLFAIIGIAALTLLHQTLGIPLKQQIEEVMMQKNRKKTTIIEQRKRTMANRSQNPVGTLSYQNLGQ